MFHSIASIQLSSLIKEEHCYSLPGFHKIFLMSFFFSAVIEPVNKIFFFSSVFPKSKCLGRKGTQMCHVHLPFRQLSKNPL